MARGSALKFRGPGRPLQRERSQDPQFDAPICHGPVEERVDQLIGLAQAHRDGKDNMLADPGEDLFHALVYVLKALGYAVRQGSTILQSLIQA
jgi:hypothetical protein